jgi:hypothetical protein
VILSGSKVDCDHKIITHPISIPDIRLIPVAHPREFLIIDHASNETEITGMMIKYIFGILASHPTNTNIIMGKPIDMGRNK